jgi:hypothetical protein
MHADDGGVREEINHRTRRASQMVLDDVTLPLRAALATS